MKEKQDSLNWVKKKPMFQDYLQLFTANEWLAMERAGFKNYCEGENYAIEVGLGYLMAMFEFKKQITLANLPISFSDCAKLTWENMQSFMKNDTTSNLSEMIDWLGTHLSNSIQKESHSTGTQVADLLSIKVIRISLEKIDEKYSDNRNFIGKDARELLRNGKMTFIQLLEIGKKIQKDLANRQMPQWTQEDPELFKMALKFNDLQLKALLDIGFELLVEENLFEAISVLRSILLGLEKYNDNLYNINSKLFKKLAIEVIQTQHQLIYETYFLVHCQEFISKSQFLEDKPVFIKKTSNISVQKPNSLLEQFFVECQKENPNIQIIEVLFKQKVNLFATDKYNKTGLDYLCMQKKPNLEFVCTLISLDFISERPVSNLMPYAEKLVLQAVQENNHQLVILLLMHAELQDKTRELCNTIAKVGKANGNLIEKFIYLYSTVRELYRLCIMSEIGQATQVETPYDTIMEERLNNYWKDLDTMKETEIHLFEKEKHNNQSGEIFLFEEENDEDSIEEKFAAQNLNQNSDDSSQELEIKKENPKFVEQQDNESTSEEDNIPQNVNINATPESKKESVLILNSIYKPEEKKTEKKKPEAKDSEEKKCIIF